MFRRRTSIAPPTKSSTTSSMIADEELFALCDEMRSIFSCRQCKSGDSLYLIQCAHSLCETCLKADECPICEADLGWKEKNVFEEGIYREVTSMKETLQGKKVTSAEKTHVDAPAIEQPMPSETEEPKVVKKTKAEKKAEKRARAEKRAKKRVEKRTRAEKKAEKKAKKKAEKRGRVEEKAKAEEEAKSEEEAKPKDEAKAETEEEAKPKGRDAKTQTVNDRRSISVQCDETPVAPVHSVDAQIQCDILLPVPEKTFHSVSTQTEPVIETTVKTDDTAIAIAAENAKLQAGIEKAAEDMRKVEEASMAVAQATGALQYAKDKQAVKEKAVEKKRITEKKAAKIVAAAETSTSTVIADTAAPTIHTTPETRGISSKVVAENKVNRSERSSRNVTVKSSSSSTNTPDGSLVQSKEAEVLPSKRNRSKRNELKVTAESSSNDVVTSTAETDFDFTMAVDISASTVTDTAATASNTIPEKRQSSTSSSTSKVDAQSVAKSSRERSRRWSALTEKTAPAASESTTEPEDAASLIELKNVTKRKAKDQTSSASVKSLQSKRRRSVSQSSSTNEPEPKPETATTEPVASNLKAGSEITFNLDRYRPLDASTRSFRKRIAAVFEKKDPVVLGSGLSSSQKQKLQNAAATFKFKLVSEWSPSVTHLVVALADHVNKKDKLTVRSIKYLLALMGNKWIVSLEWILDSEKSNRLLSEEAYEVRGYRGCETINCPRNSRFDCIRLLENYVFYFNGPYRKFQSFDEMKEACKLAGATVADTLDEFSSLLNDQKVDDKEKKKFIIINDKDDTSTVLPDFSSVQHIPVTKLVDKMANLQKP